MIFKDNTPLYSVEIERKEGEEVIYVNYMGAGFIPSIADDAVIMGRTVDYLVKNQKISRVVFVQQRNYDYPFEQVKLLSEIASLYNYLVFHESALLPEKLQIFGNISEIYRDLVYLLDLLKSNPFGCYSELNKRIKIYRMESESKSVLNKKGLINYVRFLERFYSLLGKTELIKRISKSTEEFNLGREVYREIFRPNILPNFTFTRLMAQLPSESRLIDQYEIGGEDNVGVTILKKENDPKYIYHILPPEYSLTEEHHLLINLARNVLTEHRPKAEEFTDPERTRQVFFNVAKDLLSELSKNKGIDLTNNVLEKLSRILVRYTVGFGLIEILLMDKNLNDVVLNAPIAQNAIFVRHSKYDECITNVIPSYEDADSWAAKLRLQSGRPLDESNPILDSDLVFGNVRARIAAITKPLSPSGLAYAFRRHRDEPWTLPLFIDNKMMNSFAAGLLGFLIDGSRTMLVAGTRSSGKTSLLGALMLEIIPRVRTIVLEDSVSGDNKIFLKENGKFKKVFIGEFIDSKIKEKGFKDVDGREKVRINNVSVFSVDKRNKIVLNKAKTLIRHKTNKKIYEIITKSGKRIKITEDHSIFGFGRRGFLKKKKPLNFKKNDLIAVAGKLHFDNSLSKFYLDLNRNFLRFLGKWFFDGCYSKENVVLEDGRLFVHYIVKKFKEKFDIQGRKVFFKGGFLKKKMIKMKIFSNKELPSWIYNLSDKQIKWFVEGFFGKDFGEGSSLVINPELVDDLNYLFLRFGLFLKSLKKNNYEILSFKKFKNDSDVFWDKVEKIRKINWKGYVYDISVPENENFVCEGVIAHNTLELPVDSLRKIGYDIQRMKVRSALVKGGTEIEASEGIRTSLRLGDSALIVGEVRSSEAKALYEAMRVGALANVVAGTIHGDSPYGVFDRVVNDLSVPPTSFKATDIIVITNPVKTADGLHSMKRVIGITEVRKHWNKDPSLERGFVDLMRYNVEKDELEPTAELINGDSEIIKSIAGNVKGWTGNWDAVYDNILLRGKIKQEIVNAAKKLKKSSLMESSFNSVSNGAFHEISEKVRMEKGLPIGDIVFEKWKNWLYGVAEDF